jgi:nucleoside-diphosphate-sugar epimerase
MRVVVTGADGFVGRALVRALNADGHDVVATDRTIEKGVVGDLTDPAVLHQLFARPTQAVVHLATIPGGAAEKAIQESWAVNVEATRALIETAQPAGPRFLFASSIAVFGDPLPERVDDATAIAPRMLYGAHKAMMEEWIATQSRRGAIDGLSLRLPGIVARPRSPSGMISAFMSDIFHALRAGEAITLPVSPDATMWLLSRRALVTALRHGLVVPAPVARRLTLPALRVRMCDLAAEIAAATGHSATLVGYAPDSAIDAAFGRLPPLATQAADTAGFRHDGNIAALVGNVLDDLDLEDAR